MGNGKYVLGDSEDELKRLQRQGAIYAEFTERVFRKAGIGPGMRVLDIGCGAGDVSLVAARLVGPTGQVVGIDRSSAALLKARELMKSHGCTWADFREADFDALPDAAPFDALVGRFILMHLPDPTRSVRGLASRLKAGAPIAFIEMDIESLEIAPPIVQFERALGWIAEAYRRDGVEPNMGSKLYAMFRTLGLTPDLEAVSRVEGGPDAEAYEYLAETVRSLLPRIEALGIARPDEVSADDLAARLRRLSGGQDHCFFYPRMVGAWAQLTAAGSVS